MSEQCNSVRPSFQSTPSVGRATMFFAAYFASRRISIHALRGEGDQIAVIRFGQQVEISIHALRGEGD